MNGPRLFVALLIVGGAVFANSLSNPFHFDDHHSIEYNPHIRSLTQIPVFFVDPAMFSSRPRGYMYRPLLLTSYAIDRAVWAGQSAAGFRVTNLLLHVGMAALFALWVRRLLGDAIGLGAGVLFVAHPVHVEVINYISSRSDILVGLFYLAAVLLLARGRDRAGLASYAAALLAKSTAVTLPVLLWVQRTVRVGARRLSKRTMIGMAGITALYLALLLGTRFLQESAGKIPRSWVQEIWTQAKAPAFYLWSYTSPVQLNIDHAFTAESVPWAAPVLLGGALTLSVLWLAWRARGTTLALGCLWFYLVIGPYLVLPLNILVAERRTYAASCGLLLLALWAWRKASMTWRLRPLGMALLVVLSVLSVQRNQVWASHVEIWSDSVRKNPYGARAHMNLALAYKRAGDPHQALPWLQRGLDLDPGLAEGWVVLGELRLDAGDPAGAYRAWRRAASLDPTMAGVHHNLGNLAIGEGRFDDARQRFEATLQLDPNFAEARNNLGQVLEQLGLWQDACAQYEQAIADSALWTHTANPVGGAWFNLGRCAETLGRNDQAMHAYERATELLQEDERYAEFAERARQRLQVLDAGADR